MRIRRHMFSIFGTLGLTVAVATGAVANAQTPEPDSWSIDAQVIAPILDAAGNQLGLVAVGSADDELGMMVIVQGLGEGDHGIHLHETGVCDPEGETVFGSAGGHFNPLGMMHGGHAGDLGNLTASANGDAILLAGLVEMTFDDGEMGIADADGTALVIHEGPDDLVTDPSGNSGGRIACAVIAAPAA